MIKLSTILIQKIYMYFLMFLSYVHMLTKFHIYTNMLQSCTHIYFSLLTENYLLEHRLQCTSTGQS
jgi:hypothetical protein